MQRKPSIIAELWKWVRYHRAVAISATNALVILGLTCIVGALLEVSAAKETYAEARRSRRAPSPSASASRSATRLERGSRAPQPEGSLTSAGAKSRSTARRTANSSRTRVPSRTVIRPVPSVRPVEVRERRQHPVDGQQPAIPDEGGGQESDADSRMAGPPEYEELSEEELAEEELPEE